MANILNGFLDNFFGAGSGAKGNLGDYQHAARLYVDNFYRFAPKVKFLFYVVFNPTNEAIAKLNAIAGAHRPELNMLVKSVDLPSYSADVETKQQYNRKKLIQTRLNYQPVNIRFHDDNLGVTTAMMESYYKYYFRDGKHGEGRRDSIVPEYAPGIPYGSELRNKYRYGMDNEVTAPFFKDIQIYQLSRHQWQCYTIVNPLVTSFGHDNMDQRNGSDVAENVMQLAYEGVFYYRGSITEDNPSTFATNHYDKQFSPLTTAGGGSTSIFGPGGLLNGITDVANDFASGRAGLATAFSALNTIQNATQLTSESLRREGYSILTNTLRNIRENPGGLSNLAFPKTQGTGSTIQNTQANPVNLNVGRIRNSTTTLAGQARLEDVTTRYSNAATEASTALTNLTRSNADPAVLNNQQKNVLIRQAAAKRAARGDTI